MVTSRANTPISRVVKKLGRAVGTSLVWSESTAAGLSFLKTSSAAEFLAFRGGLISGSKATSPNYRHSTSTRRTQPLNPNILAWIEWYRSSGIDTLTGAVGRNGSLHGSGCDAALLPDSKRLGTKILEDAAWQKMALDVEGVLDGGVDREETLG